MSAAEARGLACRRSRPTAPEDEYRDVLAHALCPPRDALAGSFVRTRRLLPGRGRPGQVWDVEFLPLRRDGRVFGLLGRILPVSVEPAAPPIPPLPEKLADLRERVLDRRASLLPAGTTPLIGHLVQRLRLAASLRCPVLFVGAAGTGKTTLARTLHALGPGRDRALAVLDCGGLPADAREDCLFGERRGLQQQGIGTVFLRRVARLPRDLQLRLVPLVQRSASEAGPRFLASCRRPPLEEVQAGALHEELAYALDTCRIDVPPLRQRRAELPELAACFLERLNARAGKQVARIVPEAWALLQGHGWPGNLRELEAVLAVAHERAKEGQIVAVDLPAALRLPQVLGQTPAPQPERPLPYEELLQQAERRLILLALARAQGRKSKAAALLEIDRARLLRRMERLQIPDPEGTASFPIQLELEE
jgi:DNA-binding NtrC family response regulator